MWRETYRILVRIWNGTYVVVGELLFSIEHIHITDRETTLLGYQVELEWRLKVFPGASNLWFWILPHQGTLSYS